VERELTGVKASLPTSEELPAAEGGCVGGDGDAGIWRTRELGGGVGGGIWQRGEEAVAVVLAGMELLSRRPPQELGGNSGQQNERKLHGNRLSQSSRCALRRWIHPLALCGAERDIIVDAIQHL
jgi:hypothetical protein